MNATAQIGQGCFAAEKSSSTEAVRGIDPRAEVERKKLHEAAKGFEKIFASYIFADVAKKLPGTEQGNGSHIYADFFQQAISTQIADSGALGLADFLSNSMAAQSACQTQSETTHPNKEGIQP